MYQQKINEKLEETDGIQDVQTEWNKIKIVIVEVRRREKEIKNDLTKNVERLYKKRIT